MDHNPHIPAMLLTPHMQKNSSSSSYGNTPKGLPASLAGGNSNSSFFSHVVTSAGPSVPRSSNNGAGNRTSAQPRPPSRAYTSASHHPQPKYNPNPKYNYGPTSTSDSIVASATSRRHVSGPSSMQRSTNPHGQPNYSYRSIEYNQDQNYETSLTVRNKPSAPILYHGKTRNPYRRQPEGQPKLRAITAPGLVPDESKFIQSAGLKVRSDLTSKPKTEPKAPTPKVYHLRTSSLNKLPAPPDNPTPSSSRSSKVPYGDGEVGSAGCSDQIKPHMPPAPKEPAEVQSGPKMFYSSFLGSKPFSLSLSSSAKHKPMESQTHMQETEEGYNETKDLRDDSAEQETNVENPKDNSNPLDTPRSDDISEPQSVVELQVQQARSDRKMEDLEISNASLMAVNKYLEKRLRTQSKDIQILKQTGGNLPEINNDSETEDDEEIDDKFNDQLLEKDMVLPLSKDERDLAEKTKMIETRMQSHINFLESSEKVNQMMRNCILITDTLLEAASTSLEYKVDPIDIDYTASNPDLISGSSTNTSDSVSEVLTDLVTPKNSPRNHRRKKSSLDLSRPLLDDLAEESQSDLDKLNHPENEIPNLVAHNILSQASAYQPKKQLEQNSLFQNIVSSYH